MSSNQQTKVTRYGIGSSDACLIHGVPSFGRTEFDLYASMLDGGEVIDKEEHDEDQDFRMELGNILEKTLMESLSAVVEGKLGKPKSSRPGPSLYDAPLVHRDRPFIFDRPDHIMEWDDTVAVLEAKVITVYGKARSLGDNEIPENYYYQGLHHASVAKSLHPGKKVRLFYGFADLVNFNKVYIEMPLDMAEVDSHTIRCADWWNDHVVNKRPPIVTGSSAAAGKVFAGITGKREATEEEAQLLDKIAAFREIKADVEDSLSQAEGSLRRLMMESGVDKVWSDQFSYSYTETKGRSSFNKTAFEEAYPGVYSRFVKVGEPGRTSRFTINKKKGG